MPEEIVKQYGKHYLTEEEKQNAAREMSRLLVEQQEAEASRKAAASQFKAQLDSLAGQLSKIGTEYANGYRYQEIDCKVVRDTGHMKVQYFDVQTGELVCERPMGADEMQKKLFGESGQ